jgi:carbon monoxide dehydrogenase subunit G
MRIERAIEIRATPERVYEVVMDPSCLDDWVTIHESLIEAPNGELHEGAELTQCLKLAGRKFNVRWTVVKDDHPNHVVWEGKGPVGSHAQVEYDFERNERGTRFSYTNEFQLPGGAVGKLAGPAVRRFTAKELDATLKKLKNLLE